MLMIVVYSFPWGLATTSIVYRQPQPLMCHHQATDVPLINGVISVRVIMTCVRTN